MIHRKASYEQIQDPSGKIPVDEPVFLLRATDVIAPSIIQHWADMLQLLGGNEVTVAEARAQADAMQEYAAVSGSKIPD